MTREDCVEMCGDEDLLFADGFDNAILGVGQRFNDFFVIYNKKTVIETLVTRDGMTDEEALEYFDFNIVGAWMGDKTPAFLSVED